MASRLNILIVSPQMGAGSEPQPDGETDQDLVPEPEDEVEEGEQGQGGGGGGRGREPGAPEHVIRGEHLLVSRLQLTFFRLRNKCK